MRCAVYLLCLGVWTVEVDCIMVVGCVLMYASVAKTAEAYVGKEEAVEPVPYGTCDCVSRGVMS